MIQTQRLRLRTWRDEHRSAFARMHADAEVMADQGGPVDQIKSDAKFDRYRAAYTEHGVSRWAVENADGAFLGYAGVMPRLLPDHPLGPHFEIGWRFIRRAWGHGYATESAKAALEDASRGTGIKEIVSYTSADNLRSQAVMTRLKFQREPSRDFVAEYDGVGLWRGLVWVAFSARGRTQPSALMTHRIRPAREKDATLLPDIERSAARSFRTVPGLEWIAEGDVLGEDVHMSGIRSKTCWVAVDEHDTPVGFLSAEAVAGRELHIHEMSVAETFQGHGMGRALLRAAIEWAAAHHFVALTLTTFRDVPWNAPFYSRLGFKLVSAPHLDTRLSMLLRQEVDGGFAEGTRCAMRLDL